MLEVSEFVKRRDDGRKSDMGHVVVPLMGRFNNNETGERNLVLVLANETNGGLKVRTALLKLEDQGWSTGPVICDEAGMVMERSTVNDELHSALSIVQKTTQPCQLFK